MSGLGNMFRRRIDSECISKSGPARVDAAGSTPARSIETDAQVKTETGAYCRKAGVYLIDWCVFNLHNAQNHRVAAGEYR